MLWRNATRASSAVLALALMLFGPQLLRAQSGSRIKSAPSQLSLADAIALAKEESPDLLEAQNNDIDARWGVKEAYGQLLPSASVSTGFQYSAPGTPQFGVLTSSDFGISRTPAYYTSSWGLNFNYTLSGGKLYNTSMQQANRRASGAQIDATSALLETNVTRQYLVVLQAQDALTLSRETLASANENLRLADARVKVGSAIALEAKQAQVERDKAQVAVLRAENAVIAQKLQLGQVIGVTVPLDVTLTTSFAVFVPPWTEAQLLERALRRQPSLRVAAAQEVAADAQVKAARSQYLPSLAVNVGFSGYARQSGDKGALITAAQSSLAGSYSQCQLFNDVASRLTSPLPGFPANCGSATLTDAQRTAILDKNSVFPFRYTSQPWYAQLEISLPIFGGLTREHQVQTARLATDNARLRSKAQTLMVRTNVSTAYATLVTAEKAFEIEKVNREAAAEQLTLEQERYRVGSSSFVQLQDAQTRKAEADKSYLDALYAFHDALAQLQNAVGEPLEIPGNK